MVAAGFVIIQQDDDAPSGEPLIVVVTPLTGAARVGGCDKAQAEQLIDVLFALGNKDDGFGVRRYQLRETIRDAIYALEVPDMAALPVWLTLAETLRLISDNLKSQASARPMGWVNSYNEH